MFENNQYNLFITKVIILKVLLVKHILSYSNNVLNNGIKFKILEYIFY